MSDVTNLVNLINAYSLQFDELCRDRLPETNESFSFLAQDLITQIQEVLVELSNNCRMQFVKLGLLQKALEDELGISTEDKQATIGVDSFEPAGARHTRSGK